MDVEHRRNNIDRGKSKYWKKNQYQCHSVRHKFHMDRPGTESEPLG
jgi:hypothetical protein